MFLGQNFQRTLKCWLALQEAEVFEKNKPVLTLQGQEHWDTIIKDKGSLNTAVSPFWF